MSIIEAIKEKNQDKVGNGGFDFVLFFVETLKRGDVMQDLLCVDNRISPFTLSRREALSNKRQKPIKIKNFENLRPGRLLRCSYVSSCDLGIYVLPLVFNFTENVLVKIAVSVINKC